VAHSAVRVKICGLTCVEDAVACAELGADWIGLNFHPQSPRRVAPGVAAEVVAALPDSTAAVGVFVDRPAVEVAETADRVGLRIVQLHGREPPEDLLVLDRFRIIRAFRLDGPAGWETVIRYLDRAEALGRRPDEVLIDAFVPGQCGGTGSTISREILDRRPARSLPRLILAGGLTPHNVAERIARVRPWMVDVASGVESAPGRKDRAAVAAFIRAAREAVPDRSIPCPNANENNATDAAACRAGQPRRGGLSE
jgi:phosphoribosylanthranilate isomerase